MKRPTRTLLIAAVAAAVGLTAVSAASGSPTTPKPPGKVANTSVVNVPAVKALTNAPNVVVQTQYVPIAPCRIVDTRRATPNTSLQNGVVRTFLVLQTDLSGQGGNVNGCGIPQGATAIAASMTSTQALGRGFLRAWALGTPEPNATVLNYAPVGSGGVTVGAPLPIRPGAGTQMAVKIYGSPTHLVIDVLGYYREPIAAGISSSGVLGSHSSAVLAAARGVGNPTGVYVITFDQTVTGCIIVATPATTGYVLVTAVVNNNTAFLVGRTPSTGALADTPVNFTVTC